MSDRQVLLLYAVAFVSDYFDGAIARRLGVATARLRSWDSVVDTLFHLILAWVTWRMHPGEVRANTAALALCLGSLLAWLVLDALRWKAFAGYHTWCAKLFAAALLAWVVTLYGGFPTGRLLGGVCLFGTLVNLEGIVISLILRSHATDVPTIVHAIRMRQASRSV